MLLRLLHVRGIRAKAEEASVDFRVEGLYAAVHHFGKSGVIGYFRHGDSLLCKKLCRPARGQDCIAVFANEFSRKFNDSRFIAY